jgi:hypothetical protein
VDDCLGTGDGFVGLAQVRQVGDERLAVRCSVMSEIDVENIVAMRSKVTYDPPACLAAAAGHDDPHA